MSLRNDSVRFFYYGQFNGHHMIECRGTASDSLAYKPTLFYAVPLLMQDFTLQI
ncbi:hypothetical protein [Microseira wollei]|uniref:hypothetical protein n=1 Tax=Microseira wollei TaxID=467598 RepID=UPI001CFE75CA|nr:hypothetical protein [Microseira wollei]